MRVNKRLLIIVALLVIASGIGYYSLLNQREKKARAALEYLLGGEIKEKITVSMFNDDVVLFNHRRTVSNILGTDDAMTFDRFIIRGLNMDAAETGQSAPPWQAMEIQNLRYDMAASGTGEAVPDRPYAHFGKISLIGFSAPPAIFTDKQAISPSSLDSFELLTALGFERMEIHGFKADTGNMRQPRQKLSVGSFSFDITDNSSIGGFDVRDIVLSAGDNTGEEIRFSARSIQGEMDISDKALQEVINLGSSTFAMSNADAWRIMKAGYSIRDWRMRDAALTMDGKELFKIGELLINLTTASGTINASFDAKGVGIFTYTLLKVLSDPQGAQNVIPNTLLQFDGSFAVQLDAQNEQASISYELATRSSDLADISLLARFSGKSIYTPVDLFPIDANTLALNELRFSISDHGLLDLGFALAAIVNNRGITAESLPGQKEQMRALAVQILRMSAGAPTGKPVDAVRDNFLRFLEYSGSFSLVFEPVPPLTVTSFRRIKPEDLPLESTYSPPAQ
ncbi:hypothetical protein LJC59_04100 [Desulfovibrio sp. OttesenSCG-928-A18]|nr:hypothetical protein [Desulfovibrio sp. OttesenSCG-928-A18]